jgi:hypothetical protein
MEGNTDRDLLPARRILGLQEISHGGETNVSIPPPDRVSGDITCLPVVQRGFLERAIRVHH